MVILQAQYQTEAEDSIRRQCA